ncbi:MULTISPECIES: cytochrome-c peroxidase [unclassified Bradyrhizobium]|uniref:cytochrome-c peroxidase n=1 Tax=unclassified Bradyrhizobium TaxID=2631580 RepID=UPI00211DB50F|nr:MULTISPECIES: cytochrome c peroxidase [unclassified Bradyrhizobium]MDD1535754.1 tryptophan tryptophylquinone biosynthesis enzyme MauG [Bradyrhizobium sp. WBOS8]MDD1585320.1 tryptophan tryptophylquinone biosynthesis enzyme MauG [Bradyrhizobium sp. WBOS4]UUO45745.1 tryptophan tryptophylquinone biosynthesis enzyme MauG [Bradyrhizobium sp. WBOS04]UUO59395.1 tryptophan tryptophylquinone biosynthesis enzyme MauG [Bradyrhizobium sp. WBOS08]
MSKSGLSHAALLAAAIASTASSLVGFSNVGFGAAVVGESRKVEITQNAQSGLDALKAQYRRPSTIPFPKENPYTPEKAALGKKLYFDTRLSVTSAQSCASCHSPGFGWGDGLAVGVGHGMVNLGRHSPTIINAAWSAIFMWDGRLPTLEEQALGPIQAAGEMNMKLDQLMERLAAIPEYKPMFEAAFPREGMKPSTLAQAIATYERTVVSERAPFDAWIEGDEKAISADAKRGFELFNGKAQCAACHEGWNFTNEGFQDIGLPSKDVGRGEFLPAVIKMQHAFKTPGLREIDRRSPFMHDGSLATLEQVIDHYDHAGVDRPSRSDLMRPLGLTAQEKADLVAFLKTLTSELGPTAVPVLPR